MKTIHFIFVLLILGTTSCTVTKRRYTGGWHVEWHKRHKASTPQSPHSDPTVENRLFSETTVEEQIGMPEINETAGIVTEDSFPADTIRSSKKSQQLKKLARQSDLQKKTPDTQKEKKKWVPYKYRKQQEEQENSERAKSTNETDENTPSQKRTAFEIFMFIIGTLVLIYLGYGTAVGLAAICLLLFDFTITLSFAAYLIAFLIAWITFAGITALILRMWVQKRPDESQSVYKKRLWRYSMLIAVLLALITVILLGVFIFL